MKKILIGIVCLFVLFFSGCTNLSEFDKMAGLAKKALRDGMAESALQYSEKAVSLAGNTEQKSKANMLKGYACYLSGQYSNASDLFDLSLAYTSNDDSYSGKVLSLFMLKYNSLVLEYTDEIDGLAGNWSFVLNGETIEKIDLYENVALSAQLINNQQKFSEVRNKISSTLASKMEAFFND